MSIGGFSIILLFVLAAATGGAIVAVSALIGRCAAPEERALPYECGIDPVDNGKHRFSVKYFLIAVLFIIFDVEVVFLYPWAVAFKDMVKAGMGVAVIAELFVFILLLALALIYAWGRKALEWED